MAIYLCFRPIVWLGFLALPALAQTTTVEVDAGKPGITVPSDFAGLSMEVHIAQKMFLGLPDKPNNVFFQLLRNLGAGTFRFGGSSQDQHCWDPSSAPVLNRCSGPVFPKDMQSYYYASSRTGWPVLLGMNLAQNSGSWAVRQIDEAVAMYSTPEQRLGVEPGNEPDGYTAKKLADGSTIRPPGYTIGEYINDFQGYSNVFSADAFASTIPVAGPAFTGSWRLPELTQFLAAMGPRVGLATMHWYPTSRCKGTVTADQLLAPQITSDYGRVVGAWLQAAQKQNVGLQLTETNSVGCAGQPGVSDSFAATVWGVDWLLFSSKLGLRRINFHTSTTGENKINLNAYYNVIQSGPPTTAGAPFNTQVEPLYYAMHMFDAAAPGSAFLPVTLQSTANITAYALTRCPVCAVNVFVINKDLAAASPVSIGFAAPMGQASLLFLTAPSLSSMVSDIRYGGQQFDNTTGLFTGPLQTIPVAADSQGKYNFQLPNSSIAMLTVLRPTDTPASIVPAGIVNAANGTPTMAPGSLVSLYGRNLASFTEQAGTAVAPTRLAGQQITVDGIPVGQLFASPAQINFQIPFEIPPGEMTLQFSTGATIGKAVSLVVAPYAPAVFTLSQGRALQGAVLIAGTTAVAAPLGAFDNARPVHSGESLSIYCTGLGAVSNPPAAGIPASANPLSSTMGNPTVTIGGVDAQVTYSGLAPGYVGLNQINVVVPDSVPTGDAIPLTIGIGGVASNRVTIAVE